MYATISSPFLNCVGFQGGGPGCLLMLVYDHFQYSRHVVLPASGLRPASSASMRRSSVRFQLSSGVSVSTLVTPPWLSSVYSVTVLEHPATPQKIKKKIPGGNALIGLTKRPAPRRSLPPPPWGPVRFRPPLSGSRLRSHIFP